MQTPVFKIEITQGNAAFDDSPTFETAAILRRLADSLENNGQGFKHLFDSNGNCVGHCKTVQRRV